jgi:hypothetical protein
MTGRSSPRSVGTGIQKVACSHCGAHNYPSDLVCLQCGRPTSPETDTARSRAAGVISPGEFSASSVLPRGWQLFRQPNGIYTVSPPVWAQLGWARLASVVLGGFLIYLYVIHATGRGQVLKLGDTVINPLWPLTAGVAVLLGCAVWACRREQWHVGRNFLEQRISLLGLRWSYGFTDAVFRSRLSRHENRDEDGVRSVSYSRHLLVTDREKTHTLTCPESHQPEVAAFLAQQTGWIQPDLTDPDDTLL